MDFLNDFVQQALSFILSLTIALILKIYWRYFLWLSPPLVRGLIKPACLGIGCGSMSYLLFPKLAIVGTMAKFSCCNSTVWFRDAVAIQ